MITNEIQRIDNFVDNDRTNVVIQGIGFVGAAMLAAISNATDQAGNYLYNAIGVDLCGDEHSWKIDSVNTGMSPIQSSDASLDAAYREAKSRGNLLATCNEFAYSVADIVVVDMNLDINKNTLGDAADYSFTFDSYLKGIRAIGDHISPETLVIIESTVPPGSTENVIYPFLKGIFEERNLEDSSISLAHSYERVMPGEGYLSSITNYYRVFAGIDENSAEKAERFFESFINVSDYPLTRLHSTNASEMAKVLENSYRAMNIAFMQEWTEFADVAGVNLFDVIDAIRMRPTHKNIMAPGLGVGGYCLTKDALLADYGYRNIFKGEKSLSMSIEAININDMMPQFTYKLLHEANIDALNANIAILGVSYLNDVGDTRYTPTGLLFDLLSEGNSNVHLYDPYIKFWEEKDKVVNTTLHSKSGLDVEVIIFAVSHKEYREITLEQLQVAFPSLKCVVDANNVINSRVAKSIVSSGVQFIGLGKTKNS